MERGNLSKYLRIGFLLVFAFGVFRCWDYLYPSNRSLRRQSPDRSSRLKFVDGLRPNIVSDSQQQWQIFTEGREDSILVFSCPGCDQNGIVDYANEHRLLEDKLLQLNFTNVTFINGRSDQVSVNLRLNSVLEYIGLGKRVWSLDK